MGICYLHRNGGNPRGCINTVQGASLTINDSYHRSLHNLKIFGKTTQNGTPTPDAPVPLESVGDGGSVGVTVAGKNLISYPYYRANGYQNNGITYTVNDDGSITANGIATANSYFVLNNVVLYPGKYKLSGCPSDGSLNTYALQVYNTKEDGATGGLFSDEFGKGVDLTISTTKTVQFMTVIRTGYVANNLTFYPYVALKSLHDGVFKKGVPQQSLTLSTPNGLPGIPVSSGGNYTDKNGQQWICDEIDLAKGVYVQRITTDIFDGTEPWQIVSSGVSLRVRTYNVKTNYDRSGYVSCSHFQEGEIAPGVYLGSNTVPSFFVSFTSLAEWTSYLAQQYADGNPVTVQGIREKPIETSLDADTLAAYTALHTNYPNTTVFNDCGADMVLNYYTK